MAATQENRNIKVTTALGANVLLFRRMAGTDGMSELGEYHLDLLSEQSDLDIDDILGHSLSVTIDASPGVTREFNGIVTRFVLTGREGRYASYQATVRPWLWFLTRATDCRIFQELDAVAIIKKIFEKYTLADYDLSMLSATPPVLPYCVQYRESDFAFVSRLMERFGIYYYFRHEDGKHTLVLADSPAAHVPIVGEASLHYFPDGGAKARARETVYAWFAGGEIQSDEYTLRSFNFETPAVDLTAKSTVSHSYDGAARQLEQYDYPGAYLARAAGETLVKTRLESVQAGYKTVQGSATAAALAPGHLFTLEGHPRLDQNGGMLVVSASYRMHADVFEARQGPAGADAPPPFDCAFTAIPKDAVWRSAQRTPLPIVRGPQTAIVVGKAGEEIWTDKYGRIKVQFHWDRLGAGDEQTSCWVRVAQAWAGKRFGQLFIPRIGQEVVVSFLEGDPDQPLVTGSVYNAANMPPSALPEEASRSTIKTNTTKGGGGFNEIRLDDKKGAEEIFVQAEKDYNRVVKNNDTLKVGFEKKDKGDQTIAIKNDQSTDIGNDQKLVVGNNLTVTIKGEESRTVAKDQSLSVDGSQTVTVGKSCVIEAASSIELKVGGSSIKIEPAKITIKSVQVAVEGSGPVSVKSNALVTVEGALVKIN